MIVAYLKLLESNPWIRHSFFEQQRSLVNCTPNFNLAGFWRQFREERSTGEFRWNHKGNICYVLKNDGLQSLALNMYQDMYWLSYSDPTGSNHTESRQKQLPHWRNAIPYKEATYSSTVTTFDAKSGHATSVAACFCSWVNEAVASDLKGEELVRCRRLHFKRALQQRDMISTTSGG